MSPYSGLPPRHFWSRAVSRDYQPRDIADAPEPLIKPDDKVISAGSCFAANLVPYLEAAGLTYLYTERRHAMFSHLPPENYSYDKFSAGYGNVYTVRQMLQLVRRARGTFAPQEDRWHIDGKVVDPVRPGLRYAARSNREFTVLTRRHLRAVKVALKQCTVFIFTLGLTEAWVSKADGAVFPACPGTIAGTFDPERHAFHNFTIDEVRDDLDALVAEFREINPNARIILTVSPVPLVATATNRHVVAATTYSKAVLRVAAEHATRHPNVVYFPAYEIVTSSAAPESFFEPDRRNVSKAAVDTVMEAFLSRCQTTNAIRPAVAVAPDTTSLSARIAEYECEEAAQDAG
ncbi:GSCFA domain-containing protein [Sphingomonas radiodurans]|uniref:GSCFA domain-containing protein n=1 Tax=Sphingomonas radiodurans TaxID=2890321 RepID=UPI001E2F84F7|nr:GSCFA domain-containing protein [Sphingomonas radiodurans]WBH16396.1 GSCFA domain-containing protein [Sphingomonas radiodurans]